MDGNFFLLRTLVDCALPLRWCDLHSVLFCIIPLALTVFLTNISGLSCLLEVICSAAYFVCSGSSFLLCFFPCAIVFNSIY